MKSHPVIVALLSAAFATIATCVAFREDWTFWGCAIYTSLTLVMGFLIWRHPKALVVMVLIFTLALQPSLNADVRIPQQKAGCGAVAAVVVVVIGGIVIYKLVKFCQKKFPKQTKKKDPDAGLTESTSSEAAAFNFGEMGSCGPDECGEHPAALHEAGGDPSVMTLQVHFSVDYEDEVQFVPESVTASSGAAATQTFREYQDEIASEYGVWITGTTSEHDYAVNGMAVESGESRIIWDKARMIPIVYDASRPAYLITVYRSQDLSNWETLMQMQLEEDTSFQIEDASDGGRMFYKFSAELAD